MRKVLFILISLFLLTFISVKADEVGNSINNPNVVSFGNNYLMQWNSSDGISYYSQFTLLQKSEVEVKFHVGENVDTSKLNINLRLLNSEKNYIDVIRNLDFSKYNDRSYHYITLEPGTYYTEVKATPSEGDIIKMDYEIKYRVLGIGSSYDNPFEIDLSRMNEFVGYYAGGSFSFFGHGHGSWVGSIY